ncbi:UpxY family transcription antiterminator [Flavobacterium ardleyense]|uniref:UpxY family transcription antiterminator n=1 Tax=Flavobacterium ardleyense TaxID=2038737 RepID=A0ABW5Z532_9FLAO
MKKWYVLYTKARNEKIVSDRLSKLGIENYCPLITELKQWSDRKKKVERPLFSSYVFVFIEDSKRDLVFTVSGVVRYLFWLGKPAVVNSNEMKELKEHLSSNYNSIVLESIELGSKLKIDKGFFKGFDATVEEVRNNTVKLYLEALGVIVIIDK